MNNVHYFINKNRKCALYFILGYKKTELLLTTKFFFLYKNEVLKYIMNNFNNGYYDIDCKSFVINKMKNNFKSENNKICTICFDKIKLNCFILKCNHHFHIECIKEWFSRCETCPLCKKVYGKKKLEFGIDFIIDIE